MAGMAVSRRIMRTMMSRRLFSTLALTVSTAAAVTLSAENWPQWRGPLMNGVSRETGLPLKWNGQTVENITWKLAMPSRSGATPIIWGDTIFLNVATDEKAGDIELWAVDRTKGDVRWKAPMSGGNNMQRKHNMSSPSPVTDGTFVWTLT